MSKLITSIRSIETLAEAVRSRNACIPITKVSGGDARVPNPCFGVLVVDGDDSEMRLRSGPLANEVALMDSVMLHQDASDLIPELHCVLDGYLEVNVRNLVECSGDHCVRHGVTSHFVFNEMVAADVNCENGLASDVGMVSKIARSKLHFNNLLLTSTSECSLEGELGNSWQRDGFGGDVSPYRYIIRQIGEDLDVVVKLLPGEASISTACDRGLMDAIILCFNWINGGHPFTYFRSHHREIYLVEGVVRPLQQFPRCTPLLVRPAFGANEAAQIMDCGIRLFSAKSPLAKDLELFLWQYRDATAEGPITLSMLLQGCTLLEGVVGLILRHSMCLDEKAIDALRIPGCAPEPKRKSTAMERLYCAGVHLGFDWDNELNAVFSTWKSVRNALAHGNLAVFEQTGHNNILDSYRRVIQAFNGFTLRLVGYKGRITLGGGWYAVPD